MNPLLEGTATLTSIPAVALALGDRLSHRTAKRWAFIPFPHRHRRTHTARLSPTETIESNLPS